MIPQVSVGFQRTDALPGLIDMLIIVSTEKEQGTNPIFAHRSVSVNCLVWVRGTVTGRSATIRAVALLDSSCSFLLARLQSGMV